MWMMPLRLSGSSPESTCLDRLILHSAFCFNAEHPDAWYNQFGKPLQQADKLNRIHQVGLDGVVEQWSSGEDYKAHFGSRRE